MSSYEYINPLKQAYNAYSENSIAHSYDYPAAAALTSFRGEEHQESKPLTSHAAQNNNYETSNSNQEGYQLYQSTTQTTTSSDNKGDSSILAGPHEDASSPSSNESKQLASTPPLPPSSPIPPSYTLLPEPATRTRPTRTPKKKKSYIDEDESLGRGNEGREGHAAYRRSQRMFPPRIPASKRLSNEEEYELMDFTLMKKIEEMRVLKEAFESELISRESFDLKQLQFLESVQFA